jgi:beta-lactamase superfamily II metal-dependent hydrolase
VPRAPPDSGREINDRSVVLLGTVGGQRVLLTGDLEEDIDPILVARGLPRIDFLKVAHHGSATASSAELLAVIRPRLAAISVGADNTYGHPAAATIARLRSVGAIVTRTDLDGAVEVSIGPGWMTVHSSAAASLALAAPRTAFATATPAPIAVAATGATVPAGCAIPSGG